MHVISRKALKDFASRHADASASLDAWYRVAKSAFWDSLAAVRRTYPHADAVGPYTVFNVKGNTYRLIVTIDYRYQKIFVKRVMTHAEYAKDAWK